MSWPFMCVVCVRTTSPPIPTRDDPCGVTHTHTCTHIGGMPSVVSFLYFGSISTSVCEPLTVTTVCFLVLMEFLLLLTLMVGTTVNFTDVMDKE